MEFTVRSARPDDAGELWRLNEAFNGSGEKTAAQMERDLSTRINERVFVAQCGERLIGFCCCQVKRSFCYETLTVELTELYVEPYARRQGVAGALLAAMQDSFLGEPVERFELLTGDDNAAARAFYESCGFSLSGEVHYEREIKG